MPDNKKRASVGSQQPKFRTCDVCGVTVCLRPPAAWQQHVQGIRHRRNLLGPSCVSVFEDVGRLATIPASHQRDPIAKTLHQASRGSASTSASSLQLSTDSLNACSQLHNALMRHVPHFAGRNNKILHKVCDLFTQTMLQSAWQTVEHHIYSKPSDGCQGTQFIRGSPAELACFAWRVQSWAGGVSHIRISVPFLQADSPEGVASIAAVCLLLSRLHHAASMTSLTLTMVDLSQLYLQLLQTRGTTMTIQRAMLWSKLFKSLRDLSQLRPDLRRITLATPAGLLPDREVVELTAALLDPQPRNAVRLAVLMGSHARVGKHSPIRQLPVHLLHAILDLAVPSPPCKFHWELQAVMPATDTGTSRTQHSNNQAANEASSDHDSDSSSSSDGSESSDDDSSDGDDDEEEDGDIWHPHGNQGNHHNNNHQHQLQNSAGQHIAADVLAVCRWLS